MLFIFLLLISGVSANEKELQRLADETRLHNSLIEQYHTDVAPKTTVNFGISLLDILDVDTSKGVLTTRLWVKMAWNDPRLIWDAEAYGGIKEIRISSKKIWLPDIIPYNSVNNVNAQQNNINAVVTSSGTVLFIPPVILKTRFVPRRKTRIQNAIIKYGSWTYSNNTFNLSFYDNKQAVDLADYSDKVYTLIDSTFKIAGKIYPCCPNDRYITATATLAIQVPRSAMKVTSSLLLASISMVVAMVFQSG